MLTLICFVFFLLCFVKLFSICKGQNNAIPARQLKLEQQKLSASAKPPDYNSDQDSDSSNDDGTFARSLHSVQSESESQVKGKDVEDFHLVKTTSQRNVSQL